MLFEVSSNITILNDKDIMISNAMIFYDMQNTFTMEFEAVFKLNFYFGTFFCYKVTIMLRFHDWVLVFSYLSCFHKVFT